MQYTNFGKFIREKRESLRPKTSLNKFAFNNDIEPAMLSRVERCLQGITLTEIGKIAQGFKIKASELIAEFENNN